MINERDPNFRTSDDPPDRDPSVRDPRLRPPTPPWTTAMSDSAWAWVAGIAVVVLVLAFVLSARNGVNTAGDNAGPLSTVGQGTLPPAAPNTPPTQTPAAPAAR